MRLWSTRVLAVVLAAVVTAAVLAGCGVKLGNDNAALPGVGEPASNGDLTVTVNSVKVLDQVTSIFGTKITPQRKGGMFVVVDLTVKNDKSEPQAVNPMDVHLVSSGDGDQQPGFLIGATGWPSQYKQFKSGSLPPGKERRGMIAFVTSKGTSLEKLVYDTGDDVAVDLGSKAMTAPKVKKVRIGQTATGGDLSLIVHSVTYPAKVSSGLWTTTPASGSKLVLVDLTVKNVGGKGYSVNPLYVLAVDEKGRTYWKGGALAMGMNESTELHLKRLKPGQKVRGKVLLSVPKKRHVKYIRYKVAVLGPPLQVAASR